MVARRSTKLHAAVLLFTAMLLPTAGPSWDTMVKNSWSHVDVMLPTACLLLCVLLATLPRARSTASASLRPTPSVVFLSNYPCWVKTVVPKLQLVTSRLLVVSNKSELQEFCREVGCDFMLFPLCTDSLSFARICKEDATYRSKVEMVYAALRDWAPDLLVTAGFHVLPPHAVTIPRQAALNFHPSKLPLYRGGLPFQAQLLRGETHLECCVHVMTDVIDDAQDVLARGVELSLEGKTTQQLFEEVGQLFPELILEAIEALQKTRTAEMPSAFKDLPHSFGVKAETWIDETGEKKRSNAGVLSRVRIEWEEDSAVDIERACRAFTVPGFKGLFTDYEGTPCRVTHCLLLAMELPQAPAPGTVLWADADGRGGRCAVATVDGAVLLTLEATEDVEVVAGGKFESVTLVSTWLQKPFTDRVKGRTRFE
eukprot:s2688_g2.t1